MATRSATDKVDSVVHMARTRSWICGRDNPATRASSITASSDAHSPSSANMRTSAGRARDRAAPVSGVGLSREPFLAIHPKSTLIPMIAPVAVGQMRFTLPGLAADARGVVSGREMAARFATLDRVVWFLRLLSAAGDLDACWSGMRLIPVRSPLGLREMLLLLPVPSTEAADLVARAARTAGGQAATGAGRHFVEYRDARASLGYDVAEVARGSGDFVFYLADQVVYFQAEGERSLVRLLLGLDLLRRPGGSSDALGDGGACYVTARRGLGARLCQYLCRVGVDARAAQRALLAYTPASGCFASRTCQPDFAA